MTTDVALVEAERLGIRLFAKEGGRLGYDAPVGLLTSELKAILIANKVEILARLASGDSPACRVGESKPRRLPWRATVGSWPIELRQRWGDRANALQDGGLEWHEAERVAFEEVERTGR